MPLQMCDNVALRVRPGKARTPLHALIRLIHKTQSGCDHPMCPADALTEVAQQMKALEARLLPGPIVKQASGNPFAELEPGHEATSTVSQLSSPASSPVQWQASGGAVGF